MASVSSFHKQTYSALAALLGVWGCGHTAHHSPAGGTVAEAGAPSAPVVSCGTTSRDGGDPIVEICAANETCCSCGCGPDDTCSQEPACSPPAGERCGNDACREGYVCCNAICGVCAKSAEACTTVAGRCEAVGMDPSFDRCSDIFPTDPGIQSLGTLETLLPRFRGRWLLCSRESQAASASPNDEVAGLDVTSDGHYFVLAREGDHYVRRDTAATRGTVQLPIVGNPIPELDFHPEMGATMSTVLLLSDDPKALWLVPEPAWTVPLGGRYISDPTVNIE